MQNNTTSPQDLHLSPVTVIGFQEPEDLSFGAVKELMEKSNWTSTSFENWTPLRLVKSIC